MGVGKQEAVGEGKWEMEAKPSWIPSLPSKKPHVNNCHGHPGTFVPPVSSDQFHFLIKMDAVEFVARRESLHFKFPQFLPVGWFV